MAGEKFHPTTKRRMQAAFDFACEMAKLYEIDVEKFNWKVGPIELRKGEIPGLFVVEARHKTVEHVGWYFEVWAYGKKRELHKFSRIRLQALVNSDGKIIKTFEG